MDYQSVQTLISDIMYVSEEENTETVKVEINNRRNKRIMSYEFKVLNEGDVIFINKITVL